MILPMRLGRASHQNDDVNADTPLLRTMTGGNALRRTLLALMSGTLLTAALFQPWAGTSTAFAYPIVAENERAVVEKNVEKKVEMMQATEPVPAPAPAPAQEPAPRPVPSSRGGDRPTPDISTPDKFIAAVAVAAKDSQLDSGVPASVTIAQGILESEWGRSGLAKKGQNYFGIKSKSGPGPAGIITMATWEVLGGKDVTVKDGFKAYHNLYESVMDHGRFLLTNTRYAKAFQTSDPKEFTKRMHEAGYATDPSYTKKVVGLMDKYNLYQYDAK